MAGRGYFLTGTDTGVGKTLVACALVRVLRALGADVGVMKPVETGVGERGPEDAVALHDAAGGPDPLCLVCPERFALAAAPSVAASAEGREVDLDRIREAFAALRARHRVMVVEGAGGLLVPLTRDFSIASLALEMQLPLLVVARGGLGTINHTLLTLQAADSAGLPVAGVVISHGPHLLSPADAANLGALRSALGERLVGEVPSLGRGEDAGASLRLERLRPPPC
jgi:dethiobiotin synthetase